MYINKNFLNNKVDLLEVEAGGGINMEIILKILCSVLVLVTTIFLLRYTHVYMSARYDKYKKIFERMVIIVCILILCGLLCMIYLACEDLQQFFLMILIALLLIGVVLLGYFHDKLPKGLQRFIDITDIVFSILSLFDKDYSANDCGAGSKEGEIDRAIKRFDDRIKNMLVIKQKELKRKILVLWV